jgi:hypothetical protein
LICSRTQFVQLIAVQHLAVGGRLVTVVVKDVPAAEAQIFQAAQVDELLDGRYPVVGALAQAYGSHLGERSDRLGNAAADGFHPGDEGRGHGAHAGTQHSQFPRSTGDFGFLGVGHVLLLSLAPGMMRLRNEVVNSNVDRFGTNAF